MGSGTVHYSKGYLPQMSSIRVEFKRPVLWAGIFWFRINLTFKTRGEQDE
jgi:hypothetical protein